MYRPVRRPEYGGHIERLIRTIKFQVRRLAGGLIVRQRGRRLEMPRKAVFSLPEFECWLATYIVNIYHKKEHKSLGISPYERYQQGVLGNAGQPGSGPRPRYHDKLQVERDFMPLIERSIQRYGVRVDGLDYYDTILRSFIGSRALNSSGQPPRQFIFKRDPRDLRHIYFLHPDTLIYHPIPLGNMSLPKISLWELHDIRRQHLAHNPDSKRLTKAQIFKGLDRLSAIAKEASRKTGKMTKAGRRLRNSADSTRQAHETTVPRSITQIALPSSPILFDKEPFTQSDQLTHLFTDVTSFDDLEDGTLNS
jgi:putative transposase